ncbi:MAG: MOSC domain-containing protein [Methylophilaceae bacterium]|jgi:MOSC domain-containing protein YiiM
MKLVSVNVATPKTVNINGEEVLTGIYKAPVQEATWARLLGLDGDNQADKKVHGGPHQAVYCYPFEHYAFWQNALSRQDLSVAAFGENFTISGLSEDNVCIGDVLKMGKATFQVTMPRIPCFKLAHKLGDKAMIKQFLHSGRSGFYCRVLTEGKVKAEDAISIISRDPQAISVHTALILYKLDLNLLNNPTAILKKVLSIESLAPLLQQAYSNRLLSLKMLI